MIKSYPIQSNPIHSSSQKRHKHKWATSRGPTSLASQREDAVLKAQFGRVSRWTQVEDVVAVASVILTRKVFYTDPHLIREQVFAWHRQPYVSTVLFFAGETPRWGRNCRYLEANGVSFRSLGLRSVGERYVNCYVRSILITSTNVCRIAKSSISLTNVYHSNIS